MKSYQSKNIISKKISAIIFLALLFSISFVSASICSGENLVKNPSMEESNFFNSSQCASIFSSFNNSYVKDWYGVYTGVGESFLDPYHFADYIDKRCVQPARSPYYLETKISDKASDGNRFEGGWLGIGEPHNTEYFQGSLNEPLIPGETYEISFDISGVDFISNQPSGQYYVSSIGKTAALQLDFYENKLVYPGNTGVIIPATSNIITMPSVVLQNDSYQKVVKRFVATNSARYFVVGTFAGMNQSTAFILTDNYSIKRINETECVCECSDGIDNDHDGKTDINDPDCLENPMDNQTYNPNLEEGNIDNCMLEIIWQIGKFDYNLSGLTINEYPANDYYYETFNYTINNTLNPNPDFPGYLSYGKMSEVVHDGRRPNDGAKNININFNLEDDYKNVLLIYSRYGSEKDIIKMNGNVVSENSVSENINKIFKIPIYNLLTGNNTAAISYNDSGSNNGNYIDAISLIGCKKNVCENDTSTPQSISNLHVQSKGEDYIIWEWDNPTNPDFSKNIIYINGANVANITADYYKARNLEEDTSYTITVNTMDDCGNVNDNDVSNTAKTDKEHDGGAGINYTYPEPVIYPDTSTVNYSQKSISPPDVIIKPCPTIKTKTFNYWFWLFLILVIIFILLLIALIILVVKSLV